MADGSPMTRTSQAESRSACARFRSQGQAMKAGSRSPTSADSGPAGRRMDRSSSITPVSRLAIMLPTMPHDSPRQDHTIVFVQNVLDELRRRAPPAADGHICQGHGLNPDEAASTAASCSTVSEVVRNPGDRPGAEDAPLPVCVTQAPDNTVLRSSRHLRALRGTVPALGGARAS
jgi:hypothetical protein